MRAGELLKKIAGEKKLATLVLMLLVGLALIGLSFAFSQQAEQPSDYGRDVTYAAGGVEERLARVLSQIAGAGQVEVLVTEGEQGVVGVLVVADGAQELSVRTELMRAAMTALDVPADAVEVFARQGEEAEK